MTNEHTLTATYERKREREREEERKSGWWLSAWSTVMKFLPTLFSRFAWHKDFLECTCKIVKLVNPLPLPSVFDAVLVVLYCIANMTTAELNSGLHLFTGTRRKRWSDVPVAINFNSGRCFAPELCGIFLKVGRALSKHVQKQEERRYWLSYLFRWIIVTKIIGHFAMIKLQTWFCYVFPSRKPNGFLFVSQFHYKST